MISIEIYENIYALAHFIERDWWIEVRDNLFGEKEGYIAQLQKQIGYLLNDDLEVSSITNLKQCSMPQILEIKAKMGRFYEVAGKEFFQLKKIDEESIEQKDERRKFQSNIGCLIHFRPHKSLDVLTGKIINVIRDRKDKLKYIIDYRGTYIKKNVYAEEIMIDCQQGESEGLPIIPPDPKQ